MVQAEKKQDIQAKLKNVILVTKGRGITTIINGMIHNLDFHFYEGSYKEFSELKKQHQKTRSDNSFSDIVTKIYDSTKNEDIIEITYNTLKAIGLDLEISHSNINDVLAILSDYIKDSIYSHLISGESEFDKEIIYNLIDDYVLEGNTESTLKTVTKVISDNNLNEESVSEYFNNLSETASLFKDKDKKFLIFSHTNFNMLVSKETINELNQYYSI